MCQRQTIIQHTKEMLYLVSKDGKNTSEIGEGAYCYIYSYDEYKELNLLKIDVFSNRGVWKNTIYLTIMERKLLHCRIIRLLSRWHLKRCIFGEGL